MMLGACGGDATTDTTCGGALSGTWRFDAVTFEAGEACSADTPAVSGTLTFNDNGRYSLVLNSRAWAYGAGAACGVDKAHGGWWRTDGANVCFAMAQDQLRLDAPIQQQPHPLGRHRAEGDRSGGEAIQAPALHVVDAPVAPVERRRIHHVRMGDQTAAGGRQQPGRGQGISGVAAHGAAHAGGDHQQGGQGRRRPAHGASGPGTISTASSRRPR